MKGISAVVATYRRSKELKTLLDSIISNEIPNIEVIIVDQNSDGLIDSIIEDYKNKLDIVHLKIKEPNQSKARNTGAESAKYSILCFPDDDCWFEKDSLQKTEKYFESNSQTDLLIINWKQNPRVVSNSYQLKKKDMFSFRSVGYVTYVLFFKTDVFLSLGGFIIDIGIGKYIGGGEDSELAFRAITNDLNIYYNGEIFVNHNYISIYSRDLKVLRARQRAMGLMYVMYDIPFYIILRGIVSPIVKIFIAFNGKKIRQHYNLFLGRIEGYKYGKKNKHIIKKPFKINKPFE